MKNKAQLSEFTNKVSFLLIFLFALALHFAGNKNNPNINIIPDNSFIKLDKIMILNLLFNFYVNTFMFWFIYDI